MIRTIFVLILGFIITLVSAVLVIIVSLIDWTGGTLHYSVNRLWARSILFLSGVKIEAIGIENILKDAPQVFVCNHQSAYDIFVLYAAIPAQFRWVAKKELFKIPIFGLAMSVSGQIKIDRENRTKAYDSITQAAERIKAGASIVIFPEGTRTKDGSVLEFKRGSLLLATKAEVPIIPTAIIGTYDILPKGQFRIIPSKVKIVFDKPIETKDIDRVDQKNLAHILREKIVSQFIL